MEVGDVLEIPVGGTTRLVIVRQLLKLEHGLEAVVCDSVGQRSILSVEGVANSTVKYNPILDWPHITLKASDYPTSVFLPKMVELDHVLTPLEDWAVGDFPIKTLYLNPKLKLRAKTRVALSYETKPIFSIAIPTQFQSYRQKVTPKPIAAPRSIYDRLVDDGYDDTE